MSVRRSTRALVRTVVLALAAAFLLPVVAATPAEATTGVTGQILGIAQKCLDDAAGSTADGTPIDIYDCNATNAQSWYVGSDGTLRLGGSTGKCVTVTAPATSNGNLIVLGTCTGSSAQQWATGSGGSLVNAASGKCLDTPGAHPTNGKQLQIYDCNSTPAQSWQLPTGQPLSVTAIGAQQATSGVATGFMPSVSGGTYPYQWSAAGLPPGMSLNYVDGSVQGAPTATGTFTATLTATDLRGEQSSTTFTWTVSAPSAGTAWYLDCSAATNGQGTAASPWNTVSAANGHVFSPGDSLLIRRGTTCAGQLTPQGNGTASAPITVDAYGTGAAPTIAGGGVAGTTIGNGTVGGGAVQLDNQSYWIIQNLHVTNTASAEAQRDGIEVLVTDTQQHFGITIRNNAVSDVTGYATQDSNPFWLSHGIGVDTVYDGGYITGLAITGNYVHDSSTNGIGVYGNQTTGANANTYENQDVLVSGNTVERVGNDAIVICVSDSPLVEHNVADQIGVNAPSGRNFAGIWGWADNNATYQFNEVSHIAPTSIDGEAWDCDGYNTGTCTYQNNYDHDNSGGILLVCPGCGGGKPTKVVFRNNVSVNDCRVFTNEGQLASFTFSNNTVDCGSASWDMPGATSYSNYENNIFVEPSGTQMSSTPTYTGNTYVGFAPPPSDSKASTTAPGFVATGSANYGIGTIGGYQTLTGSPDLATGVTLPNWGPNVPGTYGKDTWGNPVAAHPNRGAYLGTGIGTPVRSDDTAATYSSGWTYSGGCSPCYGGGNHWTNTAGATATFTVTGSTVSVYASLTSQNGIAAVSIDGGPATDVDLYTPGNDTYGQLVYTSPQLPSGTHTVTITCTGQADPRSTGGTYVSLDSYTVAS